MRMKLRLVLIILLITIVAIAESSVLVKRSLLLPSEESCFTCRAEDRPLGYPIIKYFNKFKDVCVKAFGALMASAKAYKLNGG